MSFYDYREAQKLNSQDVPFCSLIMAAALRADDFNLRKLRIMWPELVDETRKRYNAPGGRLPEEQIQFNKEQAERVKTLYEENGESMLKDEG